MTWLRLDDGFAEHEKVMELTDKAFRVHVKVMCWCARRGKGGKFTRQLLTEYRVTSAQLNELVEAGLWEYTETGLQVHDWNEYNLSAEDKQRQAEERAEAGRLGGLAKARNAASKPLANASENPSSGYEEISSTSRPVPEGSKDPSEGARRASPRKTVTPFLTDDERERLLAKHGPRYGLDYTDRELTHSLTVDAAFKVKSGSWFIYCDRWMDRQEQYGAPRAITGAAQPGLIDATNHFVKLPPRPVQS